MKESKLQMLARHKRELKELERSKHSEAHLTEIRALVGAGWIERLDGFAYGSRLCRDGVELTWNPERGEDCWRAELYELNLGGWCYEPTPQRAISMLRRKVERTAEMSKGVVQEIETFLSGPAKDWFK